MTLNLDEAERQARALLDSRIDSVRHLVTARQKVTDLRDQLGDAEREDARLYQAALRDGWTADELRKLGITDSPKPARVAKRRAASKPATPSPTDTAAG